MKHNSAGTARQLAGIFLDTFLLRNIVLVQAVGLCPILAAGTNLKYGVALTVCTAVVLLPTSLLMSLLRERLPNWLRPPVYTIGASVLLLGVAFLLDTFISHEIYAALYLFLPLMAVNTLVTYRAGGFSVSNRPTAALVDALGSSFGFGLVICVVSALREIAARGTIWDIPLDMTPVLPEASLPFIGFLLLAFMAALLQHFHSRLTRASERREAGEP